MNLIQNKFRSRLTDDHHRDIMAITGINLISDSIKTELKVNNGTFVINIPNINEKNIIFYFSVLIGLFPL